MVYSGMMVKGEAAAWDGTVINPLSQSNMSHPGAEWTSGWAAEQADAKKVATYSELPSSLIFQPIAFDCFGAINATGVEFSDIGHLTAEITGERRSTEFLFQRLLT